MKNLLSALIALGVVSLSAGADEPKAAAPQAVRTILEKHDQSGVPGKEIVIGTAAFPAGASIGFHTHPGDEAGLVLKGSVVLKTQGQADRTIKAGESFFNVRGAVHSVVAGPEGGAVVSTWIVDKGQPMATPVP
jgi:quercetin dioxygenase-like cupin family protein